MKRIMFIISILILSMLPIISYAKVNSNYTYVNGYYKSNGTYVNGYYRTLPNNTNTDNYSTKGNTNPFTGQTGTVQPDGYVQPEYINEQSINYQKLYINLANKYADLYSMYLKLNDNYNSLDKFYDNRYEVQVSNIHSLIVENEDLKNKLNRSNQWNSILFILLVISIIVYIKKD